MKKTFFALAMTLLAITGCDKKDKAPADPQTQSQTNDMGRDWKVYMYDSTRIDTITTHTCYAWFKATPNSATGGTGLFFTNLNGNSPDSEAVTYTLSNNNQNVVFTKTGGNASRLSGGGTWSIQFMTTDSIRMNSISNRCLKMR